MAFSVIGFIIALVLIIPFVLVLIFRPNERPERSAHNWFFTILSYCGVVTSTVILMLSQENFTQISTVDNVLFWLSLISFVVFIAVWVNYFVTRKYEAFMFAFGAIPLPIAIFTVLPLCLMSAYIQQFYLWIGALACAIGIIGNNLLTIFNNNTRPPHNRNRVNTR